MIKLQAPYNCTSASHDGVVYKANKKGVMTVTPEAARDFMKFHGFTTVHEEVHAEVDEFDDIESPSEIAKKIAEKAIDELDSELEGESEAAEKGGDFDDELDTKPVEKPAEDKKPVRNSNKKNK